MIYQTSIIQLIQDVWKNVLMQRKKSFLTLFLISVFLPLLLTVFAQPIIIIITIVLMTIFTQVSAAYIVLSTSDNLMDFKNNLFIKLFKESFWNLLKLQILKLFIYLLVGLIIGIISWILYQILDKFALALGIVLLIISFMVINCFTILSPYHVIFEHITSINALKKSSQIILYNKIMFIKMYLSLFFAIIITTLFFKTAVLTSCIGIFFEILVAYMCMKSIEVKNEV
jgi:hypothetical protein